MVNDAVQRGAGRGDVLPITEQQVRERGSRYIDFVVPGLLGMTIMGGGIWGLGFSIVDQRRKNLLKRLVATPMSRAQYLASYVISRFVLLFVEAGVLLGASALLFGVPMRGSLIGIAMIVVVSALSFGGIGLLIASRSKTIEGVSGLMNLTMLPMWVLSGVFFSSENFPERGSAVDQGASSDGDQRCASRHDVARCRPSRAVAAARGVDDLDGRVVLDCAQDLSVAVIGGWGKRDGKSACHPERSEGSGPLGTTTTSSEAVHSPNDPDPSLRSG